MTEPFFPSESSGGRARPLERAPFEEDLIATREALRETAGRFRAIFNQAAVGIALLGLDRRFLEVNRKLCEILGYPEAELVGRTVAEITFPADVERMDTNVARLLAREVEEYSYEKRYVRKDGTVVWTVTSVALLKDASGDPRNFIGVVEDVSERKRADAALAEARIHAERMSELKDEFLATLSHELRTPLSAILGWAQVIANRPMEPDDLRNAIQVIERNARAQTRLIEDLLDMSRIATGQVRLDVQDVHPASVVEAALETVRPAAEAKGIRIHKLLDPKAGPISGDPGRLQQVFWNLLSNAIKFTSKGGKVQVMLERVNSHIELSVADSGVGIRPEFLPYVFDRFRQADASTTRRHGGLGLGLAIAKHLVELHGGSLCAASEGPNLGATFTVRLPVTIVHRFNGAAERAHPTTERKTAEPATSPDLNGLRVLVVDDESDARDLLRKVLQDCGAEVRTAASAMEALQSLAGAGADVLITDIGMPEADGYELLKRVRALGAGRGGEMPVIALTAFARSEDRTNALRAGFRMHVSKPVEPVELCVAVANAAGRSGG